MLRDRSYFFLFLVPALALSACGGDKAIDETTGAVQEAIPSGGYHLAGTYTGESKRVGYFTQLVLKTDGTYHGMVTVACEIRPCSPVEENGRYALFRRDTVTYFQTYDATGNTVARFQYALRGDTLNLRKLTPNDTWTSMMRSPTAWCAMDHDCAVQDLTPGPCAGAYYCTEKSFCNYRCGAAPEIAGEGRKPGG